MWPLFRIGSSSEPRAQPRESIRSVALLCDQLIAVRVVPPDERRPAGRRRCASARSVLVGARAELEAAPEHLERLAVDAVLRGERRRVERRARERSAPGRRRGSSPTRSAGARPARCSRSCDHAAFEERLMIGRELPARAAEHVPRSPTAGRCRSRSRSRSGTASGLRSRRERERRQAAADRPGCVVTSRRRREEHVAGNAVARRPVVDAARRVGQV